MQYFSSFCQERKTKAVRYSLKNVSNVWYEVSWIVKQPNQLLISSYHQPEYSGLRDPLWLAADRRVERPGHFLDEKFLPVQPPVIYLPKGPISRVDIIWTNGNARFFSWYLGAYDFLGHTSTPKGFATGNEVTTCWRFLDELKLGFLIRVKWFFCVLCSSYYEAYSDFLWWRIVRTYNI